jgi:hypothetical protein
MNTYCNMIAIIVNTKVDASTTLFQQDEVLRVFSASVLKAFLTSMIAPFIVFRHLRNAFLAPLSLDIRV